MIEPGQIYGQLVVLKPDGRTVGREQLWLCWCSCGEFRHIRTCKLRTGMAKSCGCQQPRFKAVHGATDTKTFKVWRAMRRRCLDPDNHNYHRYGGRGITICERWKHSFIEFLKDMDECPAPDYSIERVNNNGNYEPSNCIWIPQREQAKNRRPRSEWRIRVTS